MDSIDLQVDTRELEAALKRLPAKLRGSVMRNALQAGGDVMLGALVAHTPERTDDATPDGTLPLAPGVMKAFMTTQVVMPNADGMYATANGKGASTMGSPRVKVGPENVGHDYIGRVAHWQNEGYMLTAHASRSNPDARHGKRGWKKGRVIKAIPGKHFIEAAFDESASSAVDVFLETLATGLFGDESTGADENYSGENY